MKGDTVLDYVEFQLTPPRTRCELYVSANGVTEKLASGFLKPFLTNLKAAEDQIAQGCQSIRLEHPRITRGRSWFTKGTVERFVRFVSTPEVLERVKSVEDELAQLEQVRSIQASSLLLPEEAFLPPKSTVSVDDRTLMSDCNGGSKHKHSYNVVDGTGEASKVELLRAMDVRLLALRQEQSASFTRAVAAGFSTENMADLVSFSEHFGAERLRVACLHFISALRNRNSEPFDPCMQSPSFCFADSTTQLNVRSPQLDSLQVNNVRDDRHEVSLSSSAGIENPVSRGQVGVEVRKRWGPPENIRPQIFSGFTEPDSRSDAISTDNSHMENVPQRTIDQNPQTFIHENDLSKEEPENLTLKPSSDDHSIFRTSLPHDQSPGTCSAGGSSQSDDHCALEDTQSKGNSKYESMSDPSVEAVNDTSSEAVAFSSDPIRPARRLSVQDAISLFEKKQRRDSIDVPPKQRSGKAENNRSSLDGNKAIPRRWSSFGGAEAKHNFQEQLMPFKQDVTLFSSGNSSTSTPMASNGITEVKKNMTENTLRSGDTINPSVNSELKQSPHGTNTNTDSGQHVASDDSKSRPNDTDWRTQFKQQLERSLTRDTPKSEKATGILNINIGPGNKTMGPLEEHRTSCQPTQMVPVLSKTVIKAPEESYFNPKPKTFDSSTSSFVKSVESIVPKEDNKKDIKVAEVGSGPDEIGIEPPLDNDMQALAKLIEYQTGDEEFDDQSDPKGRFYEQYRKLRDAKLMEEHEAKRAEREAKLRSMEEALTKKKAEMDARVVRLSKNSSNQSRSMKLQSLRADLHNFKKDQGNVGVERSNSSSRIQSSSTSTVTSPPFTPQVVKEEPSTSKVLGAKKASTMSVKPQNSRNSSKSGISVSPRVTTKSSTAAMSIPRRAVTATDNPLARSVPNFTNFRKENAKPSAGIQKMGSSARVHPKNGGSTRNRGEAIPSPLDANVVSSRTRSNVLTKDEKKQRSLMRKSCAAIGDLKMLSNSTDDMVLAPLTKSQRDSSTYNKLRKSAIGSFQEVKPFLKKGSGIVAGVGTNAVKQKISNQSVDVVKTSYEEAAPICETNARNEIVQFPESVNDVENVNAHLDIAVTTDGFDSTSSNDADMQVVASDEDHSPGDSDNQDLGTNFQEQGPWSDGTFESDRNCHTVSFPIGFQVHKEYNSEFPRESDENVDLRQDSILDENQASATLRANSLPHEHSMRISSSNITSPPDQGNCSPPRANSLESPVGSPTSWNLSQIHYQSVGTDAVQSNNKCVPSQKVTSNFVQSKEPAKGLKRLLKFGRKSRASDLTGAAAECVSASTTSEGDDESEDHSHLSDDAIRGKMQEKRNMIDMPGDQYCYAEDQGSSQSVRTSIPIPPANFRLRDDHLAAGGSMLKAPRSFFSLTSFRSKGTEGKTR